MEIKWLGKCECDFCHQKIVGNLYDAKTVYGPWATMCHDCYEQNGYGRLGIGLGQKYAEQPDHTFLKVEG